MNMTLEKKILATNDWGLIAMLHEALIVRLEESVEAIKFNDLTRLSVIINNCKDILTELIITFNGTDGLSTNLREIYLFTSKMMTEGELKKDSKYFSKTKDVIIPIYDAFKEMEERVEPRIVSGLTYGKEDIGDYSTRRRTIFEG